MFLYSLNENQRKSFLAMATKMAMADGHIAVQEVALLQELTDAFGDDLDVPAEEVYGAINVTPFDTRASRVLTLVGMIVIAKVDHHIHVDESTVIQEVTEAFNFSDEDCQRLTEWAEKEAALFNEINAIIDDMG